jgi:hypothetical protein
MCAHHQYDRNPTVALWSLGCIAAALGASPAGARCDLERNVFIQAAGASYVPRLVVFDKFPVEFENEGPILLIYHLLWTNDDFFYIPGAEFCAALPQPVRADVSFPLRGWCLWLPRFSVIVSSDCVYFALMLCRQRHAAVTPCAQAKKAPGSSILGQSAVQSVR